MGQDVPDLSLVRHLKAKGRLAEAERQLAVWLNQDSNNARLLFEMALVLDNQGREADAIDYYERALAGELGLGHRVDAYIGLGSSLRVVGRVFDSFTTLKNALQEYPQHIALHVVYALTLERMGNYGEAISELLQVIVESGKDDTLDLYRPALRYYRHHRHDGAADEHHHVDG